MRVIPRVRRLSSERSFAATSPTSFRARLSNARWMSALRHVSRCQGWRILAFSTQRLESALIGLPPLGGIDGIIIDHVYQRKPPFDASQAFAEFASICRNFGISEV